MQRRKAANENKYLKNKILSAILVITVIATTFLTFTISISAIDNPYPVPTRMLYLTNPMMSGDDVKYLQWGLNQLGFNCGTIDGIFGQNTKNAVISFQQKYGLSADGMFGSLSLAKMNELLQQTNPPTQTTVTQETPPIVYTATTESPVIIEKLNQIVADLNSKLTKPNVFSVDGTNCYSSGHTCHNCDLYYILPQIGEDVNVWKNLTSEAWSCCAFAKYIFIKMFGSIKDSTNLDAGRSNVLSTYEKIRTGDLIYSYKTDPTVSSNIKHYMIFLSADSEGVNVLDCNGDAKLTIRFTKYKYGSSILSERIFAWQSPKWEKVNTPGTVTIQYNANGGTNTPAAQTVKKDSNGDIYYALSTTLPIRNDYIFKGWLLFNDTTYDLDYIGSKVSIGTGNVLSDDVLVYYAQWVTDNNSIGYGTEGMTRGLTTPSNDFEIQDGVLVKYHGTAQEVTIPNGITTLGYDCFAYNNSIVKVTIPSSVTTLNQGVFYSCANLKAVVVPSSVTMIYPYAFWSDNLTVYCQNGSYAYNYVMQDTQRVSTGAVPALKDLLP